MAKPQVDLDLDALRPKGKSVGFGGQVYYLPAMIPMPTIIAAIQIQDAQRANAAKIDKLIEKVKKAREGGDADAIAKAADEYEVAETEQARILSELYQLVMELFRDVEPDLPDLRITPRECEIILALVMGAKVPEEGVEAAVADALGEESVEEGAESPPTTPQAEGEPAAAGKARKPSPSRRRSRARSSG